LDALATQPEKFSGLGLGRNRDARLAAQRRHHQFGPQRGLGKPDRNLAVEIIPFAGEDRVFAHANLDIEIAGNGARRTGFALPGQTDAIAVADAGGNPDLESARVVDPALTATAGAGVGHGLSGTRTMRTGLLDRKNSVLHAHPAVTATGRTGRSLAVCRAAAVAFRTGHERWHFDLLLDPEYRFLQIEFQQVAQIRSATRATATAAAHAEDIAEDVTENVADIAVEAAVAATADAVLERGMAVLVVGRALLPVAQDFVGFLGFLEFFLCI